ncbi:MAG: NAD-dependent epimerase/dehydratase family protein [Chloroflexota bacterium]
MSHQISCVAITGAFGNLGWKLIQHLATNQVVPKIIGLDLRGPNDAQMRVIEQFAGQTDIGWVEANLTDWHDQSWRDSINSADAVVHFAAQNPYPEASWGDSAASIDINLNVAQAAADSPKTSRLVFATSNHVMGRYKDSPLAEQVGAGELTPDLEPGVGTVWHTGETLMDKPAYAVAKFAGERICMALGRRGAGKISYACIRIGWCQPGDNRPGTLSATGSPTLTSEGGVIADPASHARDERWFKSMWLSNRDFVHLFERAILADGANWPNHAILVNGMSNNSGMKWSLEATKRWLDYQPQDNVFQE